MNQPRRRVEFDNLNLLGKAVFLGGTAYRFVAESFEAIIGHATDLISQSEKAFRQGMDPNIIDAKILDEQTGQPTAKEESTSDTSTSDTSTSDTSTSDTSTSDASKD